MRLKRFPLPLTILVALFFLADACHRNPTAAAIPLNSPSGKTYTRTHIAKADDHEPFTVPVVPPGAAPNVDTFNGSARKAAKLSIATGATKSFSDLGDVLDSLIPDATMRAKNISKGPDSGRLPEEEGLVTVTAFLYASSKESDNDFHCVVGRDPKKPKRYMNVEVSALPPSTAASFAALKAARNEFKAFFTASSDGLPASGYDKYTPPIPVTITGSLFFDVDHVPPAVGPTGMKPKTAWEIHPVSSIKFEP